MNTDVLLYAMLEQARFERTMSNFGYKTKTNFFCDLSVAEVVGGERDIRYTFDNTFKEYGNDIEKITEFVMCLNHKIWAHYNKNDALSELYDELWRKGEEKVMDTFKDNEDALNYYFRTTD